MSTSNMPAILQAQSMLMATHQVTSETALGLLVWAADRRGVTVAEAAAHVCDALGADGALEHDAALPASA